MKRVISITLLLLMLVSCGQQKEVTFQDESSSENIELAEEENDIPAEVTEEYLDELRGRYPQPVLVIGDVNAETGSDAVVRMIAVNNPGILGMSGTISYDESVMTLTAAENGAVFSELLDFTTSSSLKNGCRFLWDGLELTPEQVKDGVMLNLTFEIKDDAKSGRYPIVFIPDLEGIVDTNLEVLDLEVDCGYITVK